MWQPDRISTKIKFGVRTPHLIFLLTTKHSRATCAFALILLILLYLPGTGRADENYYQIINDSPVAVNENFVKDYGYSLYVNYEGMKFLMDTGSNEKNFLNNIKAAGIRLENLDFVFLSHQHPDHTRGLYYIRKKLPSLRIYIPPDLGFSGYNFKEHNSDQQLIVVNDYLKVSSNIFLIHTNQKAWDELALLIITKKGPYLFTTNSHTNFFMRLEKAKRLAGQNIFFHSGHTARRKTLAEKITANARKMKSLNVKQVSPSHSHPSHDNIFEEVFGTGYMPAIVGKKVPLEPMAR